MTTNPPPYKLAEGSLAERVEAGATWAEVLEPEVTQ